MLHEHAEADEEGDDEGEDEDDSMFGGGGEVQAEV
jgi:hypothetical protein